MESKQQNKPLEQISPLADQEWLLRLHFSPEHIHDGEVVPTAISTSDLEERGYSLDREILVDLSVILERANAQSMRNPENREESYLSRFGCASIRHLKYEEKTAFYVEESPVSGNPAHAHILSAQKLGKGGLRKLRLLLLPYLQNLVLLNEYLNSGTRC